jgi:Ni2+-binding GTPase involved in maturation of urease and hydrogenase
MLRRAFKTMISTAHRQAREKIGLAGRPGSQRTTLITTVCSGLPAYQLLAILYPKWLLKQPDKIRRDFLWAASDSVSGGNCVVN